MMTLEEPAKPLEGHVFVHPTETGYMGMLWYIFCNCLFVFTLRLYHLTK